MLQQTIWKLNFKTSIYNSIKTHKALKRYESVTQELVYTFDQVTIYDAVSPAAKTPLIPSNLLQSFYIHIYNLKFSCLEVLVSKREILKTMVTWNWSLTPQFEFLIPLNQQAKKGVVLPSGWS